MKNLLHFFSYLGHRWRTLFADTKYRRSFIIGWSLLFFAFYISFRAARYTDGIPVISVGDLILDTIPTLDLHFMYFYGFYLIIAAVTIYPVFFRPEILPFCAKTIAAFILIRAFFISLTHIGAPADFFRLPQLDEQDGIVKLFFQNDLFFSGHAGFPFLAALLFWENKLLRFFMIGMSILQAITVLFMHVHYSIDVFSAYFITYTIYAVSDRLFNKLNGQFKNLVMTLEKKIHAAR